MLQEKQITALTDVQLTRLCQVEQIEYTMQLLFALNHWAKARDRLFFADRQGLYQVKASILRQAYAGSFIEAQGYIDGLDGFGAELAFDMAADIAAEGFLWRLEELAAFADEKAKGHKEEDQYDCIVRRLYAKITGRLTIVASDVEALETAQVREYIFQRLQALESEARATRQPIPCEELMELCIAPGDLLYVQGRRYYDLGKWDSWDELDDNDLRKLDPEGLSLVAFHYTSTIAHYIFHLPLRLAEDVVPEWIIAQLKGASLRSRESGEYYGRAITEAESLQQPIVDILRELGVDIIAACPRLLSDKHSYVLAQAMRFAAWSEEEELDDDETELDETFWQDIAMLASKQRVHPANGQRASDECPLCSTLVHSSLASARIEHWQFEHPGQDLTFNQASWVLDQISTPGQITGKKQFCETYPPDYRAPHERGWGTRYWRVETLEGWVENAMTLQS